MIRKVGRRQRHGPACRRPVRRRVKGRGLGIGQAVAASFPTYAVLRLTRRAAYHQECETCYLPRLLLLIST